MSRIAYARVCVDIKANQYLPNAVEVEVDDDEESYCIQIEYEWKPVSCEKCGIFGHKCEANPAPEPLNVEHSESHEAWTTVKTRNKTPPQQTEQGNDHGGQVAGHLHEVPVTIFNGDLPQSQPSEAWTRVEKKRGKHAAVASRAASPRKEDYRAVEKIPAAIA